MEKTPTVTFIHWKYKDGAPLPLGPVRQALFYVTLLLSLIGAVVAFPGGVLLIVVPLLIRFAVPRQIAVGPRYLICGKVIVYYGSVDKVELDSDAGQMTLHCGGQRRFVLERDKFPSNARKSAKIAANQAAKFAKASTKLLERIRHASPTVEVSGV